MDNTVIYHRPRHINATILRRLEIERDCLDCPDGQPGTTVTCPACECTMVYRGIGRLRSGALVHCFECVHSHREVHSVSIVIAE